jgi:hypothetical protein
MLTIAMIGAQVGTSLALNHFRTKRAFDRDIIFGLYTKYTDHEIHGHISFDVAL